MQEQSLRDHGSMFIGNKPFMNYVSGIVLQFTTKGASEVVLRARGKYISRAVDVAEIACRRFLDGVAVVKNVAIGSDPLSTPDGRTIHVSTIQITLGKK